MAVSRISTSSVLQGFPKSRSLLAGNTAYDPAGTWLIQRVAGTGSSNLITFSSIPQTYKHLQIRWIAKDTAGTTVASLRATCNGVAGTSYASHRITGDGSTVTVNAASSSSLMTLGWYRSNATVSAMGVGIIDINDYTSTTKNKTFRSFNGVDAATGTNADRLILASGFFNNTGAITSITIDGAGTAFTTTSTFALYGIVG